MSNIERELFKEEIINVSDNIECLGNNENKNKVRGKKFGSFEINENKSLCENNVGFVDSENKSLSENNVGFVDSENKSLCENNVGFVDSEIKSLCKNNVGFVDRENKSLSENKVWCEHSKNFGINRNSLCEKNYYDVIEEDKHFGNISRKNEICNVQKNNENQVFCGELNDEKLFSESDENMGYKELNHNYLEIYEKPYFSEIQHEQIIQMYLENILDERNKTQRPREKDGDVFYNKFKEKDNSFTLDTENSLKIDDNQILQITKANVHELSRTEKLKSILRYKHLELEQKEPIEKLTEKYADCLHIEGEKFGTTAVISHKIPTINDSKCYSE